MNEKVPVVNSPMPVLGDDMEEIKGLWTTRMLPDTGDKHQQLETQLQQFLQAPNILLYTNGHLALEAIIRGFQLTGEIITTPFTFVSTTQAIVNSGCKPVFCDIDPVTYCVDAKKIEALITDQTSAIVGVHMYGNACQVEAIDEIAQKYQLKVIYDASHAFGVHVNGQPISNYGDTSMISFHATKVFHTIEGGAIIYKDASITGELTSTRNFGLTAEEPVSHIGSNRRMNEFQAAIGICNLRIYDMDMLKRKALYKLYRSLLKENVALQLPVEQAGVYSNFAYFPIQFKSGINRDAIREILKEQHIYTQKSFYPLISDLACYADKYDSSATPVAKQVAQQILTLPLYADLSEEEVHRICHLLNQLCGQLV